MQGHREWFEGEERHTEAGPLLYNYLNQYSGFGILVKPEVVSEIDRATPAPGTLTPEMCHLAHAISQSGGIRLCRLTGQSTRTP